MGAADGRYQIMHVGELTGLRGSGEILGKRRQFGGLGGMAAFGVGSSRCLQVGGNLLGHLPILGGVRLLKLLERAEELAEGRKSGGIGTARCACFATGQTGVKNRGRVVGEIISD